MSNLFYDSTSIIYVILKFLVGLVLFFYGLEKTSTALNRIFGNTIRKLLASDSQNKIKSVLAGFLMSFVVFSSNTINIVLVSFVQAGLMKLIQAIGFILGLGIGSILIIQLVSFKFTITAFFLIITGFSFRLFFSRDVFVQFGTAILNIGLVFLGIMLMDKA
ncbi:MAG: Na/Pi symporter, partial [Bacteroidales bacterium]|nr:Na/Pi symporter [Bacteroidales bacterium]